MTRASWFLGRQHSAKAKEGAEAAEGPPLTFRRHARCSTHRKQWPHEAPIVSQHAATLIPDPVCGNEVRIVTE
jgi:hypothetical protein